MKSVTKSIVLAASALLLAQSAMADETYNCTVLLCLAHPQGYESMAQCAEPVAGLLAILDRGEKPACTGAAGQASMTFDRESVLLPCPSGTVEVGKGERVFEMSEATYAEASKVLLANETIGTAAYGAVSYEVNDPFGVNSMYGHMKDRLCVGKYVGELNIYYTGGVSGSNLDGEGKNYAPANVYDRVVGLDTKDDGWRVTVFVNGLLARVTRLKADAQAQ